MIWFIFQYQHITSLIMKNITIAIMVIKIARDIGSSIYGTPFYR